MNGGSIPKFSTGKSFWLCIYSMSSKRAHNRNSEKVQEHVYMVPVVEGVMRCMRCIYVHTWWGY